MINVCMSCKATREYPSNKLIDKCPRCDSTNIKHVSSAKNTEDSNSYLIMAIKGTLADYLIENK